MVPLTFEERNSGLPTVRKTGWTQIIFGILVLLLLVVLTTIEKPYKASVNYYKLDHMDEPPSLLKFVFKSPLGFVPNKPDTVDFQNVPLRLKQRSSDSLARRPLGTDRDGNDVLANLMEGAHVLLVGGL